MASEKKKVKGGFRATLSLIFSIVAIILSLVSYNQASTKTDLSGPIKEIQTKMGKMKTYTSMKLAEVREGTAALLTNIGQGLTKENTE